MKKIISVLIIGLLSLSIADTNILSIGDYVEGVMNNDVEYQNLFADSKSKKGQVQSAKSMFDWRLGGQVSKSFFKTMASGSAYMNDMNSYSADLHVSKVFRGPSTAFSAGYAYEQSDMTILGVGASKSYKPYMYVSASQPLIHFFMDYPVAMAQFGEGLSRLQDEVKTEKYFEEQLTLYYDWVLLYLSLETTYEHYRNLLTLHQQVENQYKNDFISITDLLRSKEGVRKTEDVLATQINQLNSLVEMISRKTGLNYQKITSWDENILKPDNYVLNQIFEDRQRNRTEESYSLREQLLALEMVSILETNKTNLLAFADLKQYDLSSAPTGVFGDFGKTDYTIGLKVDMSLENNNRKGQELEIEEKGLQLLKEKEQVFRDLTLLGQNLDDSILENKKSLDRCQEIVDWNKQRLVQEQKRYNSGKVFLKTVVDTQNELLTNRNILLQKKVDGYKLIVQKLAFEDRLLEYIESFLIESNNQEE